MSVQIIKFLLNKDIYNKYGDSLSTVFQESKELNQLFHCLSKLHSNYDTDIDMTEFSTYVMANTPEKDKEIYAELLSAVNNVDTKSVILADVFADVMRRQKAYQLALSALEVSEGRKEFADLVAMTQDLDIPQDDIDNVDSLFVTNNFEELYAEEYTNPGFRWRLACLNRMLGSIRQGDFGFIFARPEAGKTTFLASEVTHFAEQLHQRITENPDKYYGPILWFNNEQVGGRVVRRCGQAMLGVDDNTIRMNQKHYYQKYVEHGGDHIKVYDDALFHKKDVEKICAAVKPSLIIFDQIDKVKGFTDDREDLRLGHIYVWARELAKIYCPIIGVCQADVSAEGKKYLTMDNVANAKTSKQAEADWILGIGQAHTEAEEYMRYLKVSKNKLPGDADSDPAMRHGQVCVRIDPSIARYMDM